MAIKTVDQMVANEGPATALSQKPALKGSVRRPLGIIFRGMFALALLVPALAVSASPVAAAHSIGASTTCNNGVGGGGGQGVICEVTIANTITPTGGSAAVTVHECIGSAGAPLSGVCSTTKTNLSAPVTVVNQCNGTVEGGGSTLRCSVVITNTFVGVTPGASGVTINQCVGSGGGIVTGCTPLQSTTGAVITQCNGTANGGTLVGLTCTATGTMSSAFAITVNQCNSSANGGGSLVICSTSMANGVSAPTNSASTTPTNSAGITQAPTTGITQAPTSSTTSDGPGSNPTPFLPLMILLALGGLVLATVVTQRRGLHN
ncbi:MAG TPA: hypothetical protein VF375_09010 [Candidatus Limnocylindrales bacterium]